MNANGIVIGLDIGGANLKAATAGGEARSLPFELWKHPERLGAALQELLQDCTLSRLAVTMTGELCDCFETKRDGIDRILAQVEEVFPATPTGVWCTTGQFISADDAREYPLEVGSANWHALATFAARRFEDGLVIDIGSTTSDIIPFLKGKPIPVGLTDRQRLHSKELVYMGVKRTPLCSLLQGDVMAEFFATAQDAYLVLDLIAENPEDRQTADGRPAIKRNAHARLARMLGGDAEFTREDETYILARRVRQKQRRLLVEAIEVVVDHMPEIPNRAIVAGSGEFLARLAWRDYAIGNQLDPELSAISLAEIAGPQVSTAACAYAVANLAEQQWVT